MGKDIVVAGYTRSFGAGLHDFLLLKTDSLGNLQWVKTYGSSNEDWAYSVYEAYDPGSTESFGAGLKDLLQTSDTGFVLAAYTQSFGAGLLEFMPDWKPNTYGDLAVYGK